MNLALLVFLIPLVAIAGLAIFVWLRRNRHSDSHLASLFRDTAGQDLIEYALMAGYVAVACAAVMPAAATAVRNILTKVKMLLHGGEMATIIPPLDVGPIRVTCAVLAVALLGIIVLRRRRNSD